MAAHLVSAVLVGGKFLAPGTEETAELRALIPNSQAWSGDSELPEDELQAAVVASAATEPATGTQASPETPLLRGDELVELVEGAVERVLAKYFASVELAESDGGDEAGNADAGVSAGGAPVEPPRGGKGSGEDVWREYAAAIGLDVTGASDRDQIIALVDARNAQQ